MTSAAQIKETISFGPFSLVGSERLLTRDGAPVELSARALDILFALLSSPNEVVTKNDLLSRAWPDVSVEEGSLRFHIANLRKALGDGQDGARYITTMPGAAIALWRQFRGRATSDRRPQRRPAFRRPICLVA